MKKVYITGVSGTGKSTIAKELERRGYYAISIDEAEGLCSWVHQQTGQKHTEEDTELNSEFVNKHDWILDIEYLKKLLDKDTEIAFVLGRAGNQNDFLPMFDKIIILQCSPEIFSKRIESRMDNDFGKDPEILKQIINGYKPYTEEMLSKGAITINTEKSLNEVVDEVIKQSMA